MKTTKTNATLQFLRRTAYDVLAVSLNPKSRFYADDCAALWSGLMRKDATQLRETIGRQRAISQVTQIEINRNCQF